MRPIGRRVEVLVLIDLIHFGWVNAAFGEQTGDRVLREVAERILSSAPIGFDFVKIDRSFVAGLDTDSWCRRIVRSITEMAYDLGLMTVAEGIETAQQREILREMGCTFGQGKLIGRPEIR
jgi:predicted signal transduction protein with EAL and GGDEF domain